MIHNGFIVAKLQLSDAKYTTVTADASFPKIKFTAYYKLKDLLITKGFFFQRVKDSSAYFFSSFSLFLHARCWESFRLFLTATGDRRRDRKLIFPPNLSRGKKILFFGGQKAKKQKAFILFLACWFWFQASLLISQRSDNGLKSANFFSIPFFWKFNGAAIFLWDKHLDFQRCWWKWEERESGLWMWIECGATGIIVCWLAGRQPLTLAGTGVDQGGERKKEWIGSDLNLNYRIYLVSLLPWKVK